MVSEAIRKRPARWGNGVRSIKPGRRAGRTAGSGVVPAGPIVLASGCR